MKKALRRLSVVLVVLLFLFPVISGIGITVTNNVIADKNAKELSSYPLPPETFLADTVASAGKFVGNGNGMQYFGSILVSSTLTAEELREYYSKAFDFIEVRPQKSADIDFIMHSDYRFDNFEEGKTYYSITRWGSAQNYVPDWLAHWLDFDLRGH